MSAEKTKTGGVSDLIVGQDMYGHSVGVHYKGADTFKTKLGAFFTLCTFVIIFYNMTSLLIAYLEDTRREEKYQENYFDRFNEGKFDLFEYNIDLVYFTSMEMDPKLGRFEIYLDTGCEPGKQLNQCIESGQLREIKS